MHRTGKYYPVAQWIVPSAGRGMTWTRSEAAWQMIVNPGAVTMTDVLSVYWAMEKADLRSLNLAEMLGDVPAPDPAAELVVTEGFLAQHPVADEWLQNPQGVVVSDGQDSQDTDPSTSHSGSDVPEANSDVDILVERCIEPYSYLLCFFCGFLLAMWVCKKRLVMTIFTLPLVRSLVRSLYRDLHQAKGSVTSSAMSVTILAGIAVI